MQIRRKSFPKAGLKETEFLIDRETGEVLDVNVKQHRYLANTKEEFFIVYSSIIGVFTQMEQSEIRVFGYLLQYADGTKFALPKAMRIEISKDTHLSERTIYNTINVLVDKGLIYKHESGAYQINPRYAFKGPTNDRNNELLAIIELGCEEC